ncbi:lipid IV(A) 3-deoxy-D-manno-octulosonic acid transferase [Legionella micdadei]|uniref:3-deoxy-D-manno-octulosonic acid transferase n=1 Tax=Legionella micdadei TaxID=451 RepID=A0A098GIE3_LEGMI|nr:lipid IV(A) 3-deoxy-D-manno-octulosonic acid transferase [Legionella micdadei]ARG96845.1 3-deoxy-D-manno-octulosonic acid transferase [Legionella micdadei]KTD26525.1 3-deoxy-D-manno-oct-2-ulosonic acid transferase [Legionella micdadei]NSL17885.1 lipid IV(A) 3-deoxy-D-manno-octulosonic acid transferase [Legionella micdadei]CEG61757.1 3-deoxy-D-manno-octulosonic-acid transferase [Legionella micdadei]SCY22561.1 3-deoxy-D-manno-octulosonic-acid transferase [Legionella micdadei]
MRQVYSFLMYLLTPYLILRLWWKGRRLPAYRQRIAERFSLDPQKQQEIDIWVHAVSLGEVIAVTPLIDALLDKKWRILMTTMTPTGAERVKVRFGDKVSHRYVPYDLPVVVNRFFKKTKPRLGLIVETELWPNLIHYATKAQVPLFLINARLSDRSCQGYKKVDFLFKPVLNQFKAIFAQSEDDAKRFKTLGADEERVVVLGNMKFDLQTQNINSEMFLELKNCWGRERTVVMVASTHDDEEQQILSRLKKLQAGLANMVLLIAPRHPERFQKVYQLSMDQGFNTGLRSQIETINPNNEVIILDSLGELLGFYQISDYAFVGGSLVPVGGHNVLEPIAMRVPVFSGPEVHNFKTICRDLQVAQAIELAENADDLIDRIIALHQDENKKRRLVDNATSVLEANKGAVQRYAAQAEAVLG